MTTEKASKYIKLRPVQPDRPSNVLPSDGGSGSITPTLTSSAFSTNEIDGEIHISSRWRIATDSAMTSIVYDTGVITDLISHDVPVSAGLSGLTEYYFDVIHIGARGGASEPSNSTSFTTLILLSEAVSLTEYTGNSPSDQSIINGLDLTIKNTMTLFSGVDTNRPTQIISKIVGTQKKRQLGFTNGFATDTESILSFDSDGYTVGQSTDFNQAGNLFNEVTMVDFPGVCSVIKYTGDGQVSQTLSHNLNMDVGMMWIMNLVSSEWVHWFDRLLATEGYETAKSGPNSGRLYFGSTLPTSTEFTVGTEALAARNMNLNGAEYLAIIFPKNSPIGIGTGSYVGTGITGQKVITGVNTGWIFIRPGSNDPGDPSIHNKASGIAGSKILEQGFNNAKVMLDSFDSDGFTLSADSDVNVNGVTYDFFYFADPNA